MVINQLDFGDTTRSGIMGNNYEKEVCKKYRYTSKCADFMMMFDLQTCLLVSRYNLPAFVLKPSPYLQSSFDPQEKN